MTRVFISSALLYGRTSLECMSHVLSTAMRANHKVFKKDDIYILRNQMGKALPLSKNVPIPSLQDKSNVEHHTCR